MKPATLIRPEHFPEMAHELVAKSAFILRTIKPILRLESMRAMRLVPRRKQPTRFHAPLIGQEMARSKSLLLISLAVSLALVVIAAGSLLGDPDQASTRAIASMGPQAVATMVLRVPQ